MSLHIQSVGTQGPDIVFLHGWGLSARIWESLAGRLKNRFRCHLVDLPGHGESPAGATGLNNWLDAVVERIDRPAVFVGWSLGGLIALGAARRYPERLQGLVLVATLARFIRERGNDYGMKQSAIEATRRGLSEDFSTTLSEFLMQQVLGEPGAARAVRSLRNDLMDQPPAQEALERGLDILFEADFRDALGDIEAPALVIAGARDRMAHPDGMAAMADAMPNAQFWRVERAAHAPFISHEKPFADRLATFVDACVQGGQAG
ncbi:pimeloyl-ACP methyl ester esterase BioH [Salinisphaera sp.]|uniref:pimeloyl-ACP methyl ester esterase BioH n=1 Tax=Salinisphaera sp. TaxID=1914330 RepID=UPI000C4E0174|nr:pimeloyl-ACP methyl ester esterase BioH [Salinisphaera sp.]MBS64072.1 pimeloyl-[acyl-carrier protein] methyl ester esterase [Salinisphaera sp.]